MARQQVGYDPGAEALRPTVSPNFQMIQPKSVEGMLSENKGFQLAAALGAPSVQNAIEKLGASKEEADKAAGEAYANSKTVDELKKEVDDGTLMASHSPVFNATVQHIYGENSLANFQNDTLSKLTTGELKFDTQEELDQYLTDARNQQLAGQSKFAVAGFDKKWNNFRESVLTAHAKVNNAEAVDRGVAEAQDNLWVKASEVMAPTFDGTKDEAAAAILDRYKLLTSSSLLRDDQRKAALTGLMGQLVSTGDVAMVDSMLNAKLDNGISVGAILGGNTVTSLKSSVQTFDNKNQHERINNEVLPYLKLADTGELKGKKAEEFENWYFDNKKYVTPSTYMAITNSQQAAEARSQAAASKALILQKADETVNVAQQNTITAINTGAYAYLPEQKILSTEGNVTDFKQKEFAIDYLQQTAIKQNLPFDRQVKLWSTNGLQNPEWEKIIAAGVSNLASVGWTYDGKNVGQLNPQGEAAIKQYIELATVNPAEADKYAGKDADLLSDIKFMVDKGGMPNVSEAAKFVNQVRTRAIGNSSIDSMKTSVKSAVDDVVSPGFFSNSYRYVTGLFGGNQDINLTSIRSDIDRRANLLLRSGQVPDAEMAVQKTVEYFSNPAVTTIINNTLYFNKDLPTVPPGQDTKKLMETFITEVPGKIADGMKLDGSRIRLEPDQSGGFTAWAGGVVLHTNDGQVVSYSKDQVSRWIGKHIETERNKLVTAPKKAAAPAKINPLTMKPMKDQSRILPEPTLNDLIVPDFAP